MRHGIEQPIDWKLMGAKLADESSCAQEQFFIHFIKEMRSWGTVFQMQLQMCEIVKGIPEEDRKIWSIFCNEHGEG